MVGQLMSAMRLHTQMSFESVDLLLEALNLIFERPHDRPYAIFTLNVRHVHAFATTATVWLSPVTGVAVALRRDTTLL